MEADIVEVSVPPPQPLPQPPAPRPSASPLVQLQREEEADLKSWLDSLAADTPIKVVIKRKKPVTGPSGEKIDGILETVDDRVDEEYLRETWGGGDYMLQIQTQQKDGKYKYLRARSISIAGKAKWPAGVELSWDKAPLAAAAPASAEDSLAGQAFATMSEFAKEERARADRMQRESQNQRGFDPMMLASITGPLAEQLKAAHATMAQMQAQILALSTREAPKDPFRDKLLERAIGDENSKIETLRAMYENRIDKLKDQHDAELKRIEDKHAAAIERLDDRHADEIKRIEAAHERELKSFEKNSEFATKQSDGATTMRIESLKSEISRLERDLNAAVTKIATLEAKKDQSLTEKAEELIKVKEAIDGIGGGGDDEDGPWYKQVIDGLANSEAAIGLVNKIAGGGPAEPQQQAPQGPIAVQPGVPFRAGDGNWYVADQDGNLQMVDPQQVRAHQQRFAQRRARRAMPARTGAPQQAGQQAPVAQQQMVPQQAPEQPQEALKPPKAAEVKMAVQFMENAVRTGTSPANFARSAQSLVPGDTLAFINKVGIDNFLDRVAPPDSVLRQLRGRKFAREVAQYLLRGEITPEVAVDVTPANDDQVELDPADGGEIDDGLDDTDGGEG